MESCWQEEHCRVCNADIIIAFQQEIDLTLLNPNTPICEFAEFRLKEKETSVGYCSLRTSTTRAMDAVKMLDVEDDELINLSLLLFPPLSP